MKPDRRFVKRPKNFWANVRTVSEQAGYAARGQNMVKAHSLEEIELALHNLSLDAAHVVDPHGNPTRFGRVLCDYFAFRADVLNRLVEPRLMHAAQAKDLFKKLKATHWKHCPLPMNKQKGEKKAEAFLTGIVNILIESCAQGHPCDFDPRGLTTITRKGAPLRTLARRIDGAFPSIINPIAVWEIKEYYYTTTFGSRVADGVYESLLDGMEIEEMREREGVHVKHYLFVDAHYTWWECGKSYLCRLIDMLHMGYVDEILFGSEVVDELPRIVGEWLAVLRKREKRSV